MSRITLLIVGYTSIPISPILTHLVLMRSNKKSLNVLYCYNCFFFLRNGNGNGGKEAGYFQLEQEILAPLAGTGKIFVLQTNNWWSQLKTAGSAIYANRHYLELYRKKRPERLFKEKGDGDTCTIYSDVYVDPTATIHSSAVVSKIHVKCVDLTND